MKTNSYKKLKSFLSQPLLFVLIMASFTSCDDDDPAKEDVPELITKLTLTFTPIDGGTPIVISASDPDGEGVQDIEADGPINLEGNTNYTLTLTLINELADPSDPAYDVTEEIEEESDEHMFFFGWTNDVFSDPNGDGNIDNRSDVVNYNDEDDNGLPLGLSTNWSTAQGTGIFRIILKHQPGLKSQTSTVTTGETDLDVSFNISVN